MTSGAFIDLNDSGRLELDFYFDFICPFTFQTYLWLNDVFELMGDGNMDLRLRFFSLAESNNKEDGWHIWEQKPEDEKAFGLLPFLAGATIRKHGSQVLLGRFYKELGMLVHKDKEKADKATIEKAAQTAGIDASILKTIFDGDIAEAAALLKAEHTEGVEKFHLFASPTLVFEETYPIWIKMMPKPSRQKALETFQQVMNVAMVQSEIMELKRPETDEQVKARFAEAFEQEIDYADYSYDDLEEVAE